MGKPTETPKHRGTIIVDTNALFDLRAEVPIEFTDGVQSHKRFMEIIPFLGKHGFDVLIPEEVVFEITRHVVASDGKTLKNVAPYLEDLREPRRDADPEDAEQVQRPKFPERKGFIHQFSQALADKIHGVHILSSVQLPENDVTRYIRDIRKAIERHPHPSEAANHEIDALVHSRSTRDMADKVMIAQLRRFAREPENGTVYVLTTDRNHLAHIADTFSNVNRIKIIDVAGFTKALTESGIIQQLGVTPKIPYQPMVAHMARRHGEYTNGDGNAPVGHIDSSCQQGKSRHGYSNDHPFADAMRELAAYLHIESPTANGVHMNGTAGAHTSRLNDRTNNGVRVTPKPDTPMSF